MVCVKWKIEPTNAHNTKNRLDSRVHFFKYFVNILVRFISKSRLIWCWNQDLFISKSISIHLEIDSSRSRDRFISKSRFIYLEIEIDSSRNRDRCDVETEKTSISVFWDWNYWNRPRWERFFCLSALYMLINFSKIIIQIVCSEKNVFIIVEHLPRSVQNFLK